MKKSFVFVLCAVLCLCMLSACTPHGALTVNGTRIDKGIVQYFTDAVRQEQPDAEEDALSAAVHRKIAVYVAVNSAFAERGLSLSASKKAEISQSVNAKWRLFGAYYTGLGVSKQDLMKIETSMGYKDAVLADYYAADGDAPIAEDTLRTYFTENYIAFQSVTGFLTTADNNGNSVPLTDSDRQRMITVFENAASAVNAGGTVAEQAAKLENVTANTETVVAVRGDANYPEDFFTQVSAIENGTAKTFVTGDYIFLVQRENLSDESRNLFSTYRLDCLKTLKGADFEKVLEAWAENYAVE